MEQQNTSNQTQTTQVVHQQVVIAKPKLKSTAVILAICFGMFAWLYTYQKDSTKFWLSLILSFVTIGIWALIAWVWSLILAISRSDSFYKNFPNG